MIPQRLTVTNFMCYRDNVPTLELEGIHVACFCGENGNGKTALLDAITWALWGQARARTQEELIHQGQQDMAVELEFSARDQRYRVSRRHARSARSRQGSTMLELQVASGDGFRPITGNTLRETEARIREILHLDFDTFINTAYLRQGDADRFTTSRPAERKATLAEVLDLSYYQDLEERAKARSRSVQEDIRDADGAIDVRRDEVARRPEYEVQLADVIATLADIEPEEASRQQAVDELRRSVDTLHRHRDELAVLDGRIQRDQEDIGHLERQVGSHEKRVREYEAAMERGEEIRRDFALLQQGRVDLDRLDKTLTQKSALDARRAKLAEEIAVKRERLAAQVSQLRSRVEDLRPRAGHLPRIDEGLRATAKEFAELVHLQESAQQQREDVQGSAAGARDLKTDSQRLLGEMKETRSKFDMLEQGDNRCPLCRQPLGTDGQGHLRREYEAQGLASKRMHEENTAQEKALEKQHDELAARLAETEAKLEQRRAQSQANQANLERDRTDSMQAQEQLTLGTAELREAESRLEAADFARDETAALAELDAELAGLGYDTGEHDRLRGRVKELQSYDALNTSLDQAAEALPVEREALTTSRGMLQRRLEELQQAEQRRATLAEELRALPESESRLAKTRALLKETEGRKEAALVRRGGLERDLQKCDSFAEELSGLETKRAGLAADKGVYDELAIAFGKNGIQALIIESAIPQLQADANELLARLTDNRMSLKLQLEEGRKDGRTGRPTEELHIKIADEVGTRDYETFSGGEAFRINFALRIALSKLLARRSGAPLPILFIDEGFGSLDRVGQERLTEAIQSIQDDFQKIIVITHIDQIKDAFPVRVEVTKTGAGSTFAVV